MNYNIKIDKCGNKRYYINNVLHREDGPAVEYVSGTKHWYRNGLLHREDGPAIECSNGYKAWYKNDLRRYRDWETDRKSTRLNSSHSAKSRMPSSA